jgi:transaldolase
MADQRREHLDALEAHHKQLEIWSARRPLTFNTMPENTLKAFTDRGELGSLMSADGGDCEAVLAAFGKAGVDIETLAAKLQDDGAKSFVASWDELPVVIASKGAALGNAG